MASSASTALDSDSSKDAPHEPLLGEPPPPSRRVQAAQRKLDELREAAMALRRQHQAAHAAVERMKEQAGRHPGRRTEEQVDLAQEDARRILIEEGEALRLVLLAKDNLKKIKQGQRHVAQSSRGAQVGRLSELLLRAHAVRRG